MFTYFHCYMPETWEAQVKAGIVRPKTAGVRFVMTIGLEEWRKFNELAKKGGELYSLIAENRYPLYIDRLQGGDPVQDYPYDEDTVAEYKKILGENFFGFQMHEWLSNYKYDLDNFSNIPDEKWTAEEIAKEDYRRHRKDYFTLSAMNAEEMGKFRPKNLQEFLEAGDWLISDRQKKTGGELVSCDSYFLTFPQEIKYGVKRIMPEIGMQTPNTRLQLSFARGMCKAYGLKLGAYYECWGINPLSVCCYQKDRRNEWFEKEVDEGADGTKCGSSRSMQRRMHLYAYMAGATYMAEEWGMCNTFTDWEKFPLSPYGLIKKEFLEFVEKYSDVGKPVTPIAVVVPEDFIVEPLNVRGRTYLKYKVTGKEGRIVAGVHKGLRKVFCAASITFGTEKRPLKNCRTYDCIDVITASEAEKGEYDYFVDLTFSEEFKKKYKGKTVAATTKGINKLIERYLPCVVKGGVMKQFTENKEGEYFMLLTNNGGITSKRNEGEKVCPFSTRKAVVTVKEGYALTVEKTDGKAETKDGKVVIKLPAGGFLFAKIVTKKS